MKNKVIKLKERQVLRNPHVAVQKKKKDAAARKERIVHQEKGPESFVALPEFTSIATKASVTPITM